jgi:hypothetical protein
VLEVSLLVHNLNSAEQIQFPTFRQSRPSMSATRHHRLPAAGRVSRGAAPIASTGDSPGLHDCLPRPALAAAPSVTHRHRRHLNSEDDELCSVVGCIFIPAAKPARASIRQLSRGVWSDRKEQVCDVLKGKLIANYLPAYLGSAR